MTLACTRRAEKQSVLVFGNEGACRQIEDQTAIHLLVEVKVEIVECGLWIAKPGFLSPALQQPVASASQFIGNQT